MTDRYYGRCSLYILIFLALFFSSIGTYGVVNLTKEYNIEKIKCNYTCLNCISRNECYNEYGKLNCYDWNCESTYVIYNKKQDIYQIRKGISGFYDNEYQCEHQCNGNGTSICYWNSKDPSQFYIRKGEDLSSLWITITVTLLFFDIFIIMYLIHVCYDIYKINKKRLQEYRTISDYSDF